MNLIPFVASILGYTVMTEHEEDSSAAAASLWSVDCALVAQVSP